MTRGRTRAQSWNWAPKLPISQGAIGLRGPLTACYNFGLLPGDPFSHNSSAYDDEIPHLRLTFELYVTRTNRACGRRFLGRRFSHFGSLDPLYLPLIFLHMYKPYVLMITNHDLLYYLH